MKPSAVIIFKKSLTFLVVALIAIVVILLAILLFNFLDYFLSDLGAWVVRANQMFTLTLDLYLPILLTCANLHQSSCLSWLLLVLAQRTRILILKVRSISFSNVFLKFR
jgi:hypothetical protein